MKRVLVTGGTLDDVAPIAVFVMNVLQNNRHLFDEIIIFHNGIKKKDQEILKKIANVRFLLYDYNPPNRNDEVISYFSPMVFCKYECFKLLEEFDEVIWSDYDVVIRRNLDEFCKKSDYPFHLLECDSSLRSMFYTDYKNNIIDKYDIDKPGICTPFFLISKDIGRYMDMYHWCYEMTDLLCDDLYLPEQCVFSLLVQEFDLECAYYSFDQYACYPSDEKGGEFIIHAAGQPKFWNGLYDENWQKLYYEWIASGGSKYSELRKKIKRILIFLYTRLIGIRARKHE